MPLTLTSNGHRRDVHLKDGPVLVAYATYKGDNGYLIKFLSGCWLDPKATHQGRFVWRRNLRDTKKLLRELAQPPGVKNYVDSPCEM